MTQADWVKELDVDLEERLSNITFNMEKYKLNNYGHELPARPALDFMMKNLVKKYVDLAQQRTEKKWRNKIVDYFAGAGELWFDYIDLTEEEQKQAARDELSDLLK